jgi:hypothetical protein
LGEFSHTSNPKKEKEKWICKGHKGHFLQKGKKIATL